MGQAMTKTLEIEPLLFFQPTAKVRKRTCCKLLLRNPVVTTSLVAFLLFFYLGIPTWFYLCPWFRRHSIFLHLVDWPLQNFADPESYGLKHSTNFYLESSKGSKLGVWHILPSTQRRIDPKNSRVTSNYSFCDDERPIVLYLHGSAESRTAAYRRNLYKVLSNPPLDFHVIAFDYRGFGDSSYVTPSVSTLVEDVRVVYRWIKTRVPLSRIYVWGHSMGSGLAVRLAEETSRLGWDPSAVILEAPFTSVADATRTFPLSFFHRRLPLFDVFCSQRTRREDTNLDSLERIGNVTAPMLILHAADDSMVWSDQGKRLWQEAVERRPPGCPTPVFKEISAKHGCGHRNIHKAPELPYIITTFLNGLKLTY